jgi:serine phosphatase RsbU (regulator of sigma subunit)
LLFFVVIISQTDEKDTANHIDVPFTQQEIQLQKGDVIYTLTDGFPDQFGGPKGKKFMSKNLRELLQANAHLPMPEQKWQAVIMVLET